MLSPKLGKGLTLFGQLLQQRRGLPSCTMLTVEFANTFVNPFQAHSVGMPHRTTTMGREAVAVNINNVDVGSAQRESFLQNPGPFVHKCIEAAIRDFGGGDLTLHNAGFFYPLTHEFATG